MWPTPLQATTREKVCSCVGKHSRGPTKETRRVPTRLVLGKAHGEPLNRRVQTRLVLGKAHREPPNRRDLRSYEILEAPVVLTEGKKILSLVFIDPRSNINFITPKLAGQLQLEGTLNKTFIKRVAEEYTEREVKAYRLRVEDNKKQVHWIEAVGV